MDSSGPKEAQVQSYLPVVMCPPIASVPCALVRGHIGAIFLPSVSLIDMEIFISPEWKSGSKQTRKKNLINLSKHTKQSMYTALWQRNTYKEYRQDTQHLPFVMCPPIASVPCALVRGQIGAIFLPSLSLIDIHLNRKKGLNESPISSLHKHDFTAAQIPLELHILCSAERQKAQSVWRANDYDW